MNDVGINECIQSFGRGNVQSISKKPIENSAQREKNCSKCGSPMEHCATHQINAITFETMKDDMKSDYGFLFKEEDALKFYALFKCLKCFVRPGYNHREIECFD